MIIKSNVIPNCTWKIQREVMTVNGARALKYSPDINAAENKFIANYDPVLYVNCNTGTTWAFDTKLPTGGWLENIVFNVKEDGSYVFHAFILC